MDFGYGLMDFGLCFEFVFMLLVFFALSHLFVLSLTFRIRVIVWTL